MNRLCTMPIARIESLEARTLMTGIALGVSEVAYRGGTQLRITGTLGNDEITVKQTAAGLLLGNTGGWTKTINDSIKSLWISGSAGNNSILIDASVTINATVFGGGVNDTLAAGSGNDTLFGGSGKSILKAGAGKDTLVSLGSSSATLIGGTGFDSFWTDNNSAQKIQNLTAAEVNGGAIHKVAGFYNAGSATASGKRSSVANARAIAAAGSLKEPAVDAGVSYSTFASDPIFADGGPSANDVFQGNVGDCYYLAVLSATAKTDPARIQQNLLDLGDGTVIVQSNKNGHPVFVHEDELLPINHNGTLAYAGLGTQNSTWVALMEKAWCYMRTNVVSYAATDTGWMDEAYVALGAKPTSTFTVSSASALLNLIQKDLASGQSVTYATATAPAGSGLLDSHAYSVDHVGLDNKGNVTTLTIRNPWGTDNTGNGNGYLTVTAAQAYQAFTGLVAATV